MVRVSEHGVKFPDLLQPALVAYSKELHSNVTESLMRGDCYLDGTVGENSGFK